ncbi:hypothetical protein WICMUC_004843 [Wickerhamomyces mucosus]|uniref:Uncharacterized protein n=1 Tax=Wickerhamomyces mucosus TaxID=1378264 RepID=A0A9P8PFK3_9ASCO|nr:hypothetical protein WICMUC_004843 [Wickerhamomyces mucosus]
MYPSRGFKRTQQDQQSQSQLNGLDSNSSSFYNQNQLEFSKTHSSPRNSFPDSNDTHSNNYNSITSHKDIKFIVETTLGSGTALAQAVKLPRDENLDEWLAVHIVDFYNQINMLYGTITEFCSPMTCPRMIATSEYEYLWQDSSNSKPVSVSAPKYVECLMLWIQTLFDDENIFPSKPNQPFPPQFQALIKTIMKRLFRIYAHIYCHHFNEIIDLGMNTLLNTSFKHFLLFSDEFNLIATKDYGPLQTLVIEMLVSENTNDTKSPNNNRF